MHSFSWLRGICGVYAIRNTATDKVYIGSAADIGRRMRGHRHNLLHGKHHSLGLQKSFDKHGRDNFTVEIVAECDPESRLEVEQRFLDSMRPFGRDGYNYLRTAGSPLGTPSSQQKKDRQRAAMRKRHSRHMWKGEVRSLVEIAEMEGALESLGTIRTRLAVGWSLTDAVKKEVAETSRKYFGYGKWQSVDQWAKELGFSRSHTHKCLVSGMTPEQVRHETKQLTLNTLARHAGLTAQTFMARVMSGWSLIDALTAPREIAESRKKMRRPFAPIPNLRTAYADRTFLPHRD